jgi:hypothetical protein
MFSSHAGKKIIQTLSLDQFWTVYKLPEFQWKSRHINMSLPTWCVHFFLLCNLVTFRGGSCLDFNNLSTAEPIDSSSDVKLVFLQTVGPFKM